MSKETVTITKEKYEELVDDSNFPDCLMAAGVDSWKGSEEAQEMCYPD